MLRILMVPILLIISCSPTDPGENHQSQLPNIVFLFADDFTYSAIHALGNELIHTPNLDKLVEEGTTFTHAYNMGGWHGAICVASRSMIISGTTLWRAREIEAKWSESDSDAIERTWGRLMENAGYRTYMSGKWHITAPLDSVFQTVRNYRPGGMPGDYWVTDPTLWKKLREAYQSGTPLDSLLPLGYNRPLNQADTSWNPAEIQHGGYWEGGKHWSEVVKDDALSFIDEAADGDQPFFLYLAFNAPHDPRQAPQKYLDLYPLEEIPLPESWLPQYPYTDSIGNTPLLRDEALAPYPRTPLAIKTHMREYYAIISHLDHQIGEILRALDQAGLQENTYVFFTGDHGLAIGRHGLLGKQNLYDHSVRVPLMMKGPEVVPGQRLSNDVYLQDIMATSLELAGIEKPSYVEFNSLLEHAQGQATKSLLPNGVFGAYMNFQRMIRKDGYKLLVYPSVGEVLLFDLEKDPQEMRNLAGFPEHRHRVTELFAALIQLQSEYEDPLNLQQMYQQWSQP